MAYTISIQNQYNRTIHRSYCVLAHPPYVNNKIVEPGELITPVFFKTPKASYNAVISVEFKYEYFAFVGKLKTIEGVQRIVYTNSERVKLGTAAGDGDVIEVTFDGDVVTIQKVEEPDPASPKGTFKIKCGKKPPAGLLDGTHCVVGLAQRLEENLDPTPIAAMLYSPQNEYQIQPSGGMCISVANGSILVGHVFNHKTTKVVAIDFPQGSHQVRVIEENTGKFKYQAGEPGKSLAETTLSQLYSGKAPLPPRPLYQQQQAPARNRRPKWKDEADKLGFTSNRQLKAYHFLTKYNRTQLATFHTDQKLKNIALKANDWGNKISANENLKDEFLDDLLVLALFDCILFLDNSSSMDWEQERSDQLMDISANIVDVEAIYENTASVRIEFLNGPSRGDPVANADEARELIHSIKNVGKTPIGTELRRKILDRFVYPKMQLRGTFQPVLICVITDGDPQGEASNDKNEFKKQIQGCKKMLTARDKTLVGEKHVLFQISRVGNDDSAITFLKNLNGDTELKSILHCTSYQNVDIKYEEDDPIFTYAPAITRLAGAAFVGLKRNQDGDFVFPET